MICIQLLYVIEYNYKVGGCQKRNTRSNSCLVWVVQYVYEKLWNKQQTIQYTQKHFNIVKYIVKGVSMLLCILHK